ncbi:MAG TPA: MFS transporter [Bacteroidota bacterium]|nr:MFS transporter [Bacteroidota bacterium]
MHTRSREAFSLGLFDPLSKHFDGFRFAEGKDTLGLVRGGGTVDIRLRVDRGLTTGRLADFAHLKLACEGIGADSIKVESAALKEIDYRSGTEKAVMVVSVIAVVFFLFTFAWTVEKVKPIAAQTSLKSDLRDLSRNSPWFILVGASIFTIFLNTIRDGAAVYYFTYYFKGLTNIEFSSSVVLAMSTLYLLLGQAANIVGVVMAKPVSDRIGKKKTFFIAMVNAALLSFIFYFLNRTDVTMILIFQFLISVNAGIIFPLIWSMFADTADYSEWKNKRRATGLVFSAASMSQKFGASVGIAMVGWILSFYGYRANVEQADTALQGIRMMLSFYPGVGALLAAAFVFIYPLKESVLSTIAEELKVFRAGSENRA